MHWIVEMNTHMLPVRRPEFRKTLLPLSLLKLLCVIFKHRYFSIFHLYQFSITFKELVIIVTSVPFALKGVINNCICNPDRDTGSSSI